MFYKEFFRQFFKVDILWHSLSIFISLSFHRHFDMLFYQTLWWGWHSDGTFYSAHRHLQQARCISRCQNANKKGRSWLKKVIVRVIILLELLFSHLLPRFFPLIFWADWSLSQACLWAHIWRQSCSQKSWAAQLSQPPRQATQASCQHFLWGNHCLF